MCDAASLTEPNPPTSKMITGMAIQLRHQIQKTYSIPTFDEAQRVRPIMRMHKETLKFTWLNGAHKTATRVSWTITLKNPQKESQAKCGLVFTLVPTQHLPSSSNRILKHLLSHVVNACLNWSWNAEPKMPKLKTQSYNKSFTCGTWGCLHRHFRHNMAPRRQFFHSSGCV